MIKFLYANGDSYGFGAELGTGDIHVFDDHKRKYCYSGIITDTLEIKGYLNNSIQGGSNERILRCLITDIPTLLTQYKPEEIFCTVTLSSPVRREFCDNEGRYMLFLPHHKPAHPGGLIHMNVLWKILVKEFSNDYGIYLYNYMITLSIQNFLRNLKIPYLITYSMRTLRESEIESNFISPDQRALLCANRLYDERSFMEFVDRDKYPHLTGPGLHPLEDGHQMWANFLLGHIEKNDLLNNKDLQ